MKKQHSPEPWETASGPVSLFIISPESGDAIAKLSVDEPTSEANASRIVACVNACKGFNPIAVPMAILCCEAALSYLLLEPHLDKSLLIMELERTIAQSRSKK